MIDFTEWFIQSAVPDEPIRDISLFSFYSINDRLYRIRTGKFVREILADSYSTNIAVNIKNELKRK